MDVVGDVGLGELVFGVVLGGEGVLGEVVGAEGGGFFFW